MKNRFHTAFGEGRQLVNAARKYNRVVQCGTQSRSSVALQDAVEFVQGGLLGKIKYAIGTCYKPRPSIGRLKKPLTIPKHIDYDLWCGPAQKVDIFRPRLHYDWHWDFNTGNGDTGNQGIHQMDIARWFLGEDALAPRVLSIGGRLGYRDAGDTPNSQIVLHDYPEAPLIFETRGLPKSKTAQTTNENWAASMDRLRGSQIGCIIQCEDGHLVIPSYYEATAFDSDGNEINTWTEGGNHFANWIQAVKDRDPTQLNANILEGHLSSSLCHLGNLSHRLGKTASVKAIEAAIDNHGLFAESFQRLNDHLKKNAIDFKTTPLTLGKQIEINTRSESSMDEQVAKLLRRDDRAGFEVPDLSESVATG